MPKKKDTTKNQQRAASNVSQLPQSSKIPEGMTKMAGGFAETWKPVDVGDSIHGVVSMAPKELTLNKGTKKENTTRVMELTDLDGAAKAVWESATLVTLFDTVEAFNNPLGFDVYIEFTGLGKKKAGQNAAKLFDVATASVEDWAQADVDIG